MLIIFRDRVAQNFPTSLFVALVSQAHIVIGTGGGMIRSVYGRRGFPLLSAVCVCVCCEHVNTLQARGAGKVTLLRMTLPRGGMNEPQLVRAVYLFAPKKTLCVLVPATRYHICVCGPNTNCFLDVCLHV